MKRRHISLAMALIPFHRAVAQLSGRSYKDLTQLSLGEQMQIRGFRLGAPVFIRIFKEESLLELWMQQADGSYKMYQKFPICIYSGDLGPKERQGDRQSPEGFYNIVRSGLQPNSRYHRALNLGFPNAYDRANGYTGDYLMIHGACISVGCYAMGDKQIEIIYEIVEAALKDGQESVPVHIFPFRLSTGKLAQYRANRWQPFWKMLKPGYDYFERHKNVPTIQVIAKRYQVVEAATSLSSAQHLQR